jgi:hypothetical protein
MLIFSRGWEIRNLWLQTNSWVNADRNYTSKNDEISSYVQPCNPLFSCFVYKQSRNHSSTILHTSTVQSVIKNWSTYAIIILKTPKTYTLYNGVSKNRVSTLMTRTLLQFWSTHDLCTADGTHHPPPRNQGLHPSNEEIGAKWRQLVSCWSLLLICGQFGASKGIQRDGNCWAQD